MKIRLEYQKKKAILFVCIMVVFFLLWVAADCPVWTYLVFGVTFAALLVAKIELNEKLPWLWTVLIVSAGGMLTTFSIQYLLLNEELLLKTRQEKWELNILCVLVVYLSVLVCSARPAISCVIANSVLLLFGFVDYFVYMFRQNEFSFADLKAVGTGLSVASGYTFQLTPHAVYVLFWAALYITFAAQCRIVFERRIAARIIALQLCILAGLPVAMCIDSFNTETWEQKGTYRNGYVLNFLLQIRDSFIQEPEGYDPEVVVELEKQFSGDGSSYCVTDVKDPVILVIMNESFADLTTIGDFHTNLPVMSFFDSIKENAVKGYALSSVFGAKTPNSEWEFQTGNTMSFLPSGSVVYQQYLNQSPYSLLTTLKKEGYTCVAMHPYYASGWNRDTVYPKLGYDEMYFIEDFDQEAVVREYITDRELYRKIIERYENRKKGEKLFVMGITMQNHGGYVEDYENFEEKYYKTGKSYTDANQFLSLIHESDEALEELVRYFESEGQPVEIVFFGDHQPSLNSGFYKILNGRGLSGLTLEQLENLYKVPFFIWTNYATPEETIPVTSLNYLSALTLERAGIALPPYSQFLEELRKVVPAMNPRGYYSIENQKYLHLDDASGEEAAWLKKYEILQYNAMFDKKNRSEVFFPE